jgi:hypothetical protein
VEGKDSGRSPVRSGAAAKRHGRFQASDSIREIANLLAHGLIRASFIPPAPIRDLRDLTRHRKSLIRDRVKTTNRVHKLLETANIKLANVVADVLGVSGRAMLEALMAGETDPQRLAKLARGSLTPKVKLLAEALRGGFTSHHVCGPTFMRDFPAACRAMVPLVEFTTKALGLEF